MYGKQTETAIAALSRLAEVWDGDESKGYTFKKSHAVSYAALVALHMNLTNPSVSQE
jgi:hypothetical protein